MSEQTPGSGELPTVQLTIGRVPVKRLGAAEDLVISRFGAVLLGDGLGVKDGDALALIERAFTQGQIPALFGAIWHAMSRPRPGPVDIVSQNDVEIALWQLVGYLIEKPADECRATLDREDLIRYAAALLQEDRKVHLFTDRLLTSLESWGTRIVTTIAQASTLLTTLSEHARQSAATAAAGAGGGRSSGGTTSSSGPSSPPPAGSSNTSSGSTARSSSATSPPSPTAASLRSTRKTRT